MSTLVLALNVVAMSLWGYAASPAPTPGAAQSAAQVASAPTVFRISGRLTTATGEPRTGEVMLVASLYAGQNDVDPLWVEQQTVTLDASGRYTLMVGGTLPDGVPQEHFQTGAGRWLGIAVSGEAEQPRIMLVTVPYAVRAREADTLAGKTAADFVLNENLATSVKTALKAETTSVQGVAGVIPNTFNAAGPLEVQQGANNAGAGILVIDSTQTANFRFWADATQGYLYGGSLGQLPLVMNAGGGYVGVATTSPAAPLDVNGAVRATTLGLGGLPTVGKLEIFQSSNDAAAGIVVVDSTQSANFRFWADASKGYLYGGSLGQLPLVINAGGGYVGIGTSSPTARLDVSGTANISGNVGIGTTSPSAKLDVNGSINVSGNINAKYQDVAEWVEVSAPLEAGTVVIVDPLAPNRVKRAARAYDTRVAGAVSAMPGLVLGEKGENKVLVAQSGRVRIKVDAGYGAIRIGDLLATSPTPGHAMKSKAVRVGGIRVHRPGTLVGRALEPWHRGKGEILVLLGGQ